MQPVLYALLHNTGAPPSHIFLEKQKRQGANALPQCNLY